MNVFTMKASRLLRECLAVACMIFTVVSCTRDEYSGETEPSYVGEPVEVSLALKVSSVQVIGATMNGDGSASGPVTRTVTDPAGLETQVSDIWVFQFDKAGRQLTSPSYYTIQTEEGKITPLRMMLHACEDSQIYVVANTNDASWGNNRLSLSLAELSDQTFLFTSEQNVYKGEKQNLLMAALHKQTIVAGQENVLNIALKSLFAKIQFRYALAAVVQDKLHVTSMQLFNIPNRVRLGNAVENNTDIYPADGDFTTIDGEETYPPVSQPVAGEVYTWYIPQNQQGTVSNNDPKLKNEYAPAHAFYIRMRVDSELDGASYTYTVYPGANTYNDFNVRNGNLYNVKVTFNTGITDDRVTADPANCFVMRRNSQIQFDPYTRTETGGGFKYTDYVDVNNPDKSFERVDILWQTGDGTNFTIGNNTNGNLVYYDKAKRRVHVASGNADGNAVIAGYNAKGVIVWSWHIWVNENRPAQLANAQEYYTYRWDSDSIYYNDPRVKGHSFMMCNLGATGTLDELRGIIKGSIKPYGVFYQWGRKDPFPPTTRGLDDRFSPPYVYPDVAKVYDNNAKLLPMSSTAGQPGSFQATKIDANTGNIEYAIRNPMVFMGTVDIGSFETFTSEAQTNNPALYVNDGDWLWGHNDRLWGGIPFEEASINYKNIIANNGAEQKSIFDPCPAGWILPKSDAWMGFTINGLNQPYDVSKQNNRNPTTVKVDRGMEIYLEAWHSGPVGWFPVTGWRTADGSLFSTNYCGGYFTSAAGIDHSIFILHIHPTWLNTYETFYPYMRRANAYPVRCVREEK